MRAKQSLPILIVALLTMASGCSTFSGLSLPGSNSSAGSGSRQAGYRKIDPDEALDPLGERSPDRLTIDDLSPGNLATTWQARASGPESPAEAQQFFAEAQQTYTSAVETRASETEPAASSKLFEDAAQKFRVAASRWPDSSVEEDSLYKEGESWFFADHYVEANRAFEKLISLYSGTRYLDKAEARRFAIARYWLELSRTDKSIVLNDPKRPRAGLRSEARRILHRIRLDDPTGKIADDATLALANAYFEDKSYLDAGDTYEDLRKNYPGSEHQYHAHMFELKSRLNSYRGPDYDDIPLQQADDLMRLIVAQFPQQAADNKEFLAKEATNIRNQMAQRDITMANYFAGRGENRAATIYLQEVADEFSDTGITGEVQQQIAELETLPANPSQRAKWLVAMFPENEEEKPVLNQGSSTIFR